jgi:hypothetical protein
MKWKFCALAALGMAIAGSTPAKADEPLFGYIYTTDLLPKGQKEIENWTTLREGRSNGDFHLFQNRTEVSYGATSNFQISGYMNLAYGNVKHDGPDGSTIPPEVFADYNSTSTGRFRKFRFESASLEAIYRFSSPYTSPIGAAIYLEPSIGPRTKELEARLILQKNFIDDKLVFAFNATLGYEWRRLHGDPEADPTTIDFRSHIDKETDINFGLAGSYRFAPGWSFGAEIQNEREFAGLDPFKADHRTNLAWYSGPTLHYGGRHFFATFTTLFQLPWAHDYAESDPMQDAVIHGISNADDFEKYRFRVKVGYYF